MRLADLVRGQKVERALNILRFSSKKLKKIREILSVINNWEQKNEMLIWKKLVFVKKLQ
jgi:large subunit ribosomal protein L22